MQTARRVNPNLAEPLLVNDNVFAPATVTRKRRAAPAIGNNAVKQATPWRIWLMSAPPENHRPRRAGSARFDTYYKVQYWDPRNCAWADIQKQHPTPEAAAAAYIAGRQCRTMEVTAAGRRPL
jgi:hypothetical protein